MKCSTIDKGPSEDPPGEGSSKMEQPSTPPPPPNPPPGQERDSGQHKKIKTRQDPTISSEGLRGADHGYFLERMSGQKCLGCERGIPFRERIDHRIELGSIGPKTLKVMQDIGADIYIWCCALCPQHQAFNEERLKNKPQLRHGRCCVRGPLTDGNRIPSENCRHLGNLDDPFRVGTDRQHWYREPSQNMETNVPSTSNLDQFIIDEDEQSSAPSTNSPQPLLPPGNFDDGPDEFEKVEQEETAWPGSDTSPTADWQ